MQQIEEFTATQAEFGLKERWKINITTIQMTTNHKTPEIITLSDLFNGMCTMIVLGAMTFQASVEVPEVRSMTAMANRKVGMESLEISRTNVVCVEPTTTS